MSAMTHASGNRWRRLACVGGTALAVLATAGPSTMAENSWDVMRDPTVVRGGWIASPKPQAKIVARPRPKAVVTQRRSVSPAAVIVHDAPVLPKADPSSFVVVMGDTMAELLANGLDDAFADRTDIAILRKDRADSGLVRTDFHDWGKFVQDLLASDQKITVGVMLLGSNDRQSVREGDVTHEPLSERWREIYKERIDAVASAFAARKVPLIWVGAPPMQSSRLTTDIIAFNEMFRQRVERAGGTYVDLWEAFIDSENRYNAYGPDLSGQVARLRAADGVHFTRAGARKAAHFTDVAIRRFLQNEAPRSIIALPATLNGTDAPDALAAAPALAAAAAPAAQNIEDVINRMAGFAPNQGSAQGSIPLLLPVVPVKPVAGPILQLTGLVPARDARLINDAATARGTGYQASEIERVFADGVAPAPRNGRADDFRWPKR
jgi:uncharacterized protein